MLEPARAVPRVYIINRVRYVSFLTLKAISGFDTGLSRPAINASIEGLEERFPGRVLENVPQKGFLRSSPVPPNNTLRSMKL